MNCRKLQQKRVFGLWKINGARVAVLALTILTVMTAMPTFGASLVMPPPTPPAITPPPGNTAYLLGHATGTQGYVCLPSGTGASWTVNASRPQATLFINIIGGFSQQILTHFLSPDTNPNQYAPSPLPFGSPTWQSSFDSSAIWGNKLGSINAGTDPSCPSSGAISCLLLQVIGTQLGPSYKTGVLTPATYVQRLNTTGGSAPDTGCAVSTDVGGQVLVPYTADYYFYKAN
ncbi:MAG TPA: DUF3455 domain-containing protein [Bryobacteraceae bacterium]|nr:DUF3455 domain-containing protein [Bryobacteraceae bacterium]